MKFTITLLCVLVTLWLLSGCAKLNPFQEPPDYPVIDSLAPSSGTIGTQVRLWGSGFSTITSLDTVRINGVLVRVDSPSNSTVLLVTLIDSTGTGPVQISVKGRSAKGPIFTWLGGGGNQVAPVITTADVGWADGRGYSISVNSLPPTDNTIHLFEGGVEIPIKHVVRPGADYYDPATGLRLLVDDDAAVLANAVNIYANFQVTYSGIPSNVFPYQLKPVITNIFSRKGDYRFAAGDTLTIQGNFFGAPTLPSSVDLVYNGLPLTGPTIISWSNMEIKAVMPAYPTVLPDAGIPVEVKVGQVASNRMACTYLGAISANVTLIAGSSQGYADATGAAAQFNGPAGLALDAAGNLYVADQYNHRIRKITPAGVVTTLAGSTSGFRDGAAATALFNMPAGVGVDETGAVYVADFANHRIRTISGGIVGTTVGDGGTATLAYPTDIAMKDHNLFFVADAGNHRIREVINFSVFTLAGSLAGFADGAGTAAKFNQPHGVALAPDGTIYVADELNYAIRKITPAGVVSTLAGGTQGKLDGTGQAAQFELPHALVLDAQGNIYVADFNNSHIRKITPQGVVTSLAAQFVAGSDPADFSAPNGIAIDAQGALYISDAGNQRIYKMVF